MMFGNRRSNIIWYQTCDLEIVHDPVYDNGLAGRARERALHMQESHAHLFLAIEMQLKVFGV